MKKNTDNVERAFKDEFMSRPAALCHGDWQSDVMRYVADSTPPCVKMVLNTGKLVWPLAWSAAAAAVLIVSVAYLLLDPSASSFAQTLSDIGPAQQIVAAL